MTKRTLSPSAFIGFGVCADPDSKQAKKQTKKATIDPGHGAALVEIEQVDGGWFKQHPNRTRYMRPVLSAEKQHVAPGATVALITQIEPGLRTQAYFSLTSVTAPEFCADFDTDESCEKLACDLFAAGDKKYRDLVRGVTKKIADTTSAMAAVLADDEAWFKDREVGIRRVRAPATVERAVSPGITLVIVSQLEKDMRVRRGIPLDPKWTAYALKHGDDCIGMDQGAPIIIAPGSVINGRALEW